MAGYMVGTVLLIVVIGFAANLVYQLIFGKMNRRIKKSGEYEW